MVLPEDVHRRIGETAPDGLWVLDGAGRTVHVSARACALLGRSASSLAGANPFHLVEVDHHQGLYGLLTALLAGESSVPDVHARVRLRGGEERDLMLRGRSIDDPQTGGLAVFWLSEVSQQERLQEELAFQRDELIEAQQLARMASWRLDLVTREVIWSDAMFDLLDRDRSAGPMTLPEVVRRVHPEDRDLIYASREEAYRAGKVDVTFRYLQSDGTTTWLRCRGAVRSARGGQSNILLSCLLDISQQKETELALTMSARLADLQRALASDANKSATVAEALDRMLLRAESFEPGLRAITFFPTTGADGQTVLDPVYPGRSYAGPARGHDQPTERERACARRALETGDVVINEYPDRTVEMGRSISYADQVFVVAVLTTVDTATSNDIRRSVFETVSSQLVRVAERERTNAALKAARDQAIEASRHKSEFLATMSHELRTPLNGVIGLNELLLRGELNPEQRRIAEGVQVAGQTLRAVINDILDFSKIEAGRLELETVDFAVREVVDGSAALLGERAHEHGIELAASVGKDVPEYVRGDPTRLAQVLTNLISNAVKFTAEGEVVVSCERAPTVPEDPETVVLRFEVRDTGIGIPPEKIAGLFDAFAQAEMSTTRRFGGTGLGLAICRQLVAALGGDIGVTSRVGEGSTFWFTARFLGAETGGQLAGQRGHLLRGRRALVVDDNATNRSILARVLREWDVTVDEADNATAAIELLRTAVSGRNPIEVMLVDYLMPEQDGLALAARVSRDDHVPTPIMLLLLPSAQSLDGQRLADAGVARSLTKPVVRSALFDALVDGLAERHGMRRIGPRPTPSRSRATGKHLLLVEDNEINQMVALGVLEHLGYTADVAADGVEAVEMALRKPYDAILMDVQMPRMDGYEATAYIRSQEPAGRRTPIIAMTAAALDTERDRSLAVGMNDFLTKPLEADRLEQALRKWVLEPQPHPTQEPSPPVPSDVEQLLDRSRVETLQRLGARGAAIAAAGLASFIRAAPEEVQNLRAALREDDRNRLAFVAHRLRGSAANLGALTVAELSREIEELADSGGVPGAALLDRLDNAVSVTIDAMAALYGPA